MIPTLISGLIVAGITGLTILAYKHPQAYKQLKLPSTIFKFSLISIIGLLLWNYSISITFTKLSPYIKENDLSVAKSIIDKTNNPISLILLITAVFFALWLYCVFLSILPSFIKSNQKQIQDDQIKKYK